MGLHEVGVVGKIVSTLGQAGVVQAGKSNPALSQGLPAIQIAPEMTVEIQVVLEEQRVIRPQHAGRFESL